MTILNVSYFSFVIAALLAFEARGADGFTYRLTPAEIRPGERTVLEIRLAVKDPEQAPVVYDQLVTQSTEIHVLEKESKDENGQFVFRLELTTHKPGTFRLAPIEIRSGPNTYSTEALELKVATERVDGDSELRPELGEVPLPQPWGRWVAIFAGAMLSFLVARWGVKKMRRRPKKVVAPPPEPEEDPLVWLRRELDRFFAELKPEDAMPSNKSDELMSLVKIYFARVSKSPVRAWTLTEFRQKLAKDAAAKEIAIRMERWNQLHYRPAEESIELKNVAAEIEKVLLP